MTSAFALALSLVRPDEPDASAFRLMRALFPERRLPADPVRDVQTGNPLGVPQICGQSRGLVDHGAEGDLET